MQLSDTELYNLVLKVNKAFYERVYKDPWMSKVFAVVDQKFIESQQTDFIVGAMGGPKKYSGRAPQDAHPHIFVDEDMWNLREKFLVDALAEVQAPDWLREKWIRIDNAFKKAIIKNSIHDCKGRYNTEEIIYFPSTQKKSA